MTYHGLDRQYHKMTILPKLNQYIYCNDNQNPKGLQVDSKMYNKVAKARNRKAMTQKKNMVGILPYLY